MTERQCVRCAAACRTPSLTAIVEGCQRGVLCRTQFLRSVCDTFSRVFCLGVVRRLRVLPARRRRCFGRPCWGRREVECDLRCAFDSICYCIVSLQPKMKQLCNKDMHRPSLHAATCDEIVLHHHRPSRAPQVRVAGAPQGRAQNHVCKGKPAISIMRGPHVGKRGLCIKEDRPADLRSNVTEASKRAGQSMTLENSDRSDRGAAGKQSIQSDMI